ncbi:hypothetical protein [Paenibacillus lignilyticus]|uniref:GNAT family N-acetyltransferase n=1 Tax=Paenibacillus lignilyticus TaxID=1172615 RepID=A0ABS5CH40_9BACL|nr:hypothetical protein [Paenibacillus lignilyticus]MBP3965137.1 hypothetical protein [Paenibacillus lignilyticus]
MSDLSIQRCSTEDLELLAIMNKQLIEDEKHDNTMNIEQWIREIGFREIDGIFKHIGIGSGSHALE